MIHSLLSANVCEHANWLKGHSSILAASCAEFSETGASIVPASVFECAANDEPPSDVIAELFDEIVSPGRS